MFEFKFPDIGEGIQEGEIVKWRIKEGDVINADQVVAEIETDKAVVEIPTPRAGIVAKILHKEGDTVKVGEVLFLIAEKGEKIEQAPKAHLNEKHYTSSVVGQIEEAPPDAITSMQVKKALQYYQPKEILATPAVRRLARDLHVDLSKIKGSGRDGRITEEDVRSYAENKGITEIQPAAHISKQFDFQGPVERVPLKGVRKSIAEHMTKSFTTAVHVTHMDEADVTELFEIRQKEKISAEKKGVKLTFLPFIIKATIAALREYPLLNASLDDEHQEIIIKKYYNIGIATDTPDGLIVPVIKNADEKSMMDIAKEIQALSDRAQSRKLDIDDVKGSSFTITNVGGIGGVFATPIINWPDVAILALGRIQDKVVFKDEKIVVRKVLPFSVTFDHRAVDGAQIARFSNVLKEHLENPGRLLVED